MQLDLDIKIARIQNLDEDGNWVDPVVFLGHSNEGETLTMESSELRQFRAVHQHHPAIAIDRTPTGETISGIVELANDFLGGLCSLEDDSVARVNSTMALGYYTQTGERIGPSYSKEFRLDASRLSAEQIEFAQEFMQHSQNYTSSVITCAFHKLQIGGKLVVTVAEDAYESILTALSNSPFEKEAISARKIAPDNSNETYWTRFFRDHGLDLYRVKAQKTDLVLEPAPYFKLTPYQINQG